MGAARLILTILAAAGALAVASTALAQQPATAANPFNALVGKSSPAAPRLAVAKVERYVVATDNRSFLLERAGRRARLKFLCGDGDGRIDCRLDDAVPAEEIYVLSVSRAPRGDVIFRDRAGRAYLRLSPYGGATVFWPGDAAGTAATKSFGEDAPLNLPFATVEAARQRAARATAIVSARIGSPILFEVGSPPPDSQGGAAVLADAVARAARGLAFVADDATGARVIASRVQEVRFEPAAVPSVRIERRALVVNYNAELDVDGRPASAAIAAYLESAL